MKYGTLLSELSTIESLADVKADRDRLLKANKEMTENLAKYEKKLKEFPLQEIKIDQGVPGPGGGVKAKRYKLKAGTPEIGKTYEEEGMGEESIDFRVVDKGTGKEMAEKYPKAWEECKTHMSYDQWPGFLKSPVCVVLYEGFGKDDLSIVSEAYVTDCEETDGFGASVQGAAGPHGSARVREIYTQLSTAQSKLQDCALLADEVRESGLCDDVAVDMITAAIHSMADSVLPIWKKLFEYHSGPSRENLGASVKAGGQCGETEFIKNRGGKWVILDSKTGKVLSHHDSCEAAHEAMKALQFHKHGGS